MGSSLGNHYYQVVILKSVKWLMLKDKHTLNTSLASKDSDVLFFCVHKIKFFKKIIIQCEISSVAARMQSWALAHDVPKCHKPNLVAMSTLQLFGISLWWGLGIKDGWQRASVLCWTHFVPAKFCQGCAFWKVTHWSKFILLGYIPGVWAGPETSVSSSLL